MIFSKNNTFFNAEILQATHSHYKAMKYNVKVDETTQPLDDVYVLGARGV